MKTKIPLRECKLWWPAWQQGIPFTTYGFQHGHELKGDGYVFQVDPEMDSWLCPNGDLMPVSDAALMSCATGAAISWTSFTIIGSKVQVNALVDKQESSYSCKYFDIDDLYFEGEAYRDDD